MADHIAWAHVMRRMLPPGKLFDEMDTPEPIGEGPVLWRLFKAFGREWERLEQRIYQALVEMDPRGATETIEWWEKAYGLPDLRIPTLPGTLAGRRAAVAAKVVMRGAQNEAGYAALIASAGWTMLQCRRFWTTRPFRVGDRVEGRLNGVGWACTVAFQVGGATGDSLPFSDLQRLLQYTMQAHANTLVVYVP